jgi:hypothetical protein
MILINISCFILQVLSSSDLSSGEIQRSRMNGNGGRAGYGVARQSLGEISEGQLLPSNTQGNGVVVVSSKVASPPQTMEPSSAYFWGIYLFFILLFIMLFVVCVGFIV